MTRLAARFLRVISCISLVLAIVDAQNADFDPSVNHYSYSFSVANGASTRLEFSRSAPTHALTN